MQLVWRADLDWDSPLPSELAKQWHSFVVKLLTLSNIRIPRYFGTHENSSVVLCGFWDSSERGFAATVYIRFTAPNGNIIVSLVGTKTKMAPMKPVIMPRLE